MIRISIATAGVSVALLVSGCGGSDDDTERPALGGGGSSPSSSANRAEAPTPPAPTQTTTTRVQVVETLGNGKFKPEAIYKTEAPGVVTVVSLFGQAGLDSTPGQGGGEGGGGLGSGFVLNGDGEIATNAHVVTQGEGRDAKRARQVFVELADGNKVEAKIVGDDPDADIALLKIDPAGLDLHPLPLGRDSDIMVGSPVAALGSPFGERQSLSVGVVSALDRSIASLTNFQISGAVQTDAAINPGNSGGPLLNADGKVIGVNQQIKTNSGGGEGVGFAVPVDLVRRSLEQLRESGRADYAYLGVSSVELYPQLVEEFDLAVSKGAWLQEITAGGPAQRAKLEGGGDTRTFQGRAFKTGGDVVTGVEKTPIDDSDDLSKAISRYKPGDKVTLKIQRDDEVRDVQVTLAKR
ncbi:MAG: trypsin-like peptidase domain-containing protein [Solirubrobacterales bacterium]|nr:trypsin-like peptidase domain-containing protein [Solirubrobacterales bacterium]